MTPFRFFLRASEILWGYLGDVCAALCFRLALPGVVSEPALWPLVGHFSACEPAPSWESALLRLEFVYCSPLGICSGKEDTFRKLSSQECF